METLKQPLAKREAPYWGLDLDLARRMAGLLTLTVALLTLALWPLSPMSDQIGPPGWIVGSAVVLLFLAESALIFGRPSLWSYRRLALVPFSGFAGIAVFQWLAGGTGEPYENLFLLPVLFVSAIYPLGVVIPFFALVGASLAAPLIYEQVSGDLAANAVGSFLLLIGFGTAVHYMLLQVRIQRVALAREEEQAREEARVDGLTGIGNRRGFEETLVEEIARADRMGTPLTMAMGDIEDFKQINDQFGHLEGDRCLHRVAQAMDSELRTPDRVFRWGGDEFAVLLPGTDQEGGDVLVERLQAKVTAACRRPDNEPIWIHFATAALDPQMTAKELTEAADLALMAERARIHRARR